MSKIKIEIIYADDGIIVVNKPAGVSVTKDRAGSPELSDLIGKQLGAQISAQLRLVHRLDKDTSGVMILARTKETQSQFCEYFAKRLVKKTYLAIVSGAVTSRQGTINASLVCDRKKPALMHTGSKKGKEAVTEWKLLADFGTVALLAVWPLTGRTHQIRVHLSSIGLVLAIDPLYGSNRPIFLSDFKTDYRLGSGRTEKPLIERLTLHAYQIELANPQSNRPDCFIAGLDKKFAATLKMLTKHSSNGLDAFVNAGDFIRIINTEKW